MNTFDAGINREIEKFQALVDSGQLEREDLKAAGAAAACRNIPLERILRFEYDFSRRKLLEALSAYFDCGWVEYDERLPVPPELLTGLDAKQLTARRWFPVIKNGETVVIAAVDPNDPAMIDAAKKRVAAPRYEFRVALDEDITAFIEDFLNSTPDHLIGNERTGLAVWRNTLSRWRTRLACYRTDFASARTRLSLLRGGLGLIIIGRALLRIRPVAGLIPFYWLMISSGFGVVIYGLLGYFRIKRSVFSPPRHETVVEVTGATLYFLEEFQFVENKPEDFSSKKTMLARIADMLPSNCVFIDSSHDNKVRSHLAHERTSLAGQRTILSAYRTMYARARTGLAFIRTGVAFVSIGLGLIEYFGLNLLTVFDCFLIIAGLAMSADGLIWYWPVRKEHYEASNCAIMDLSGVIIR